MLGPSDKTIEETVLSLVTEQAKRLSVKIINYEVSIQRLLHGEYLRK